MTSWGFDYRDEGTTHFHPRRRVWLAVAVLAALACAVLPRTASAVVYYPPIAESAVKTADGFELKGTVFNYGGTTTWHFEYGTTTSYGTSVPMPDADAGAALATPVAEQITGLEPNMTYHYRLVSTNSVEGTGFSADRTFSTATTTAPPTGGGPTTAPTGGGGMSESAPATSPAPSVTGKGPKRVARRVNRKGRSLLATAAGRTLYTLSVERRRHFVCTAASGCTTLWMPLTVAPGVVPKGPVKLGTVRRPDGTLQVTYKGRPLYTFASDKRPGQVKGEGIRDVGVWHAAVLPRARRSRHQGRPSRHSS